MNAIAFGPVILATAFGLLLAGCDTVGLTNNVTPQVSGRVLAADTRLPLAGVKVLRVQAGQPAVAVNPPKGGQLQQQGRAVTTDANGDFVFPSSSYITFIRQARWWSLKLSFQTPHYATLQTNFTTAQVSTNAPDGTPLVQAGELLLNPLPK